MALASSNETFSESREDIIIISSFKDLKEKIDPNVNLDDLKDIFDFNENGAIETSRQELAQLREQFIQTGNLEAVKGFLERAKNSILEKTKKSVGRVKRAIEEGNRIDALSQRYGIKEGIEAGEKMAGQFEAISYTVTKLGDSEAGKKAKEATDIAKKAVKEVGASKGFDYIINKIKSFGGWIGELIAGILSIFKGLIGMGDKAEKVKEVAEKVLSPEEVEKTKKEALTVIESSLGKYLTPDNKKILEERINNLSEKELSQISDKAKKGNLTISDIKSIIPNIIEGFLSKEQIDKVKEDFNKSLISTMEKGIKEKYNVDVTGEKKIALEKLIRENTTISNDQIETILMIQQNKKLLISDVFGGTFDAVLNTSLITFGLLTKGIVPLSAFSLDFLNSTTDIALLSLNALGIQKEIKLDSLNKKLSKLEEDEKALFIALLYRKGGILFSIVGSLMGGLTRFGIEASTTTNVKSFDLLKSSVLGDYTKQSENLKKLEKSLGVDTKIGEELSRYSENIEHIIDNYKKLQILEKANGDINIAKKLFAEKNIHIPSKINTIEGLLGHFRDNSVKISTGFIEKGFLPSRFGFGKNADLHRLSKRIEYITKAQNIMFSDIKIFKLYGKAKEALNIGELSRDVDKVMFHYDSIEDAKKGLSKWNVLANKSPELVKGLFDKFPIIVVAGLAINSEEGFLESFKENLIYLLPVVGSIMLIKDTGIDWSEDGKIKAINPLDAGIGAALFAIDGIFITKEFAKGGFSGAGKYIIKPIADMYSIARGGVEGVSYLGKTISSGKSISSIIEKSKGLAKGLPKAIPGKLKAILGVLATGYFGIEYAMADDTLSELFSKDGKLDEVKLKEYMLSGEISDDEKIILLKYLISEEWGDSYIEGLDINISNNKLSIISSNSTVKTKSIVNKKMLELLGLDTELEFKYINKI